LIGGVLVEIGSEYNLNSNKVGENEYFQISNYPNRWFLSGRTGLYCIGREISNTVSEVMMPQYCCASMVAPFVAQGINVLFYNSFDLANVKMDESKQAILVMDYFGFLSDETLSFISRCKALGKIVIVDATQTAFSYSNAYDEADYIVVSYRKWLDCLCAVVYSKNGFGTDDCTNNNISYTTTWRKAAGLKTNYLKGMPVNKQDFLDLYANANHQLDSDYSDYKPEETELAVLANTDSAFLRKKRRQNAVFLIDEVKKLSLDFDVGLMYDSVGDKDCPLFVPILVKEDKRGVIRQTLIKNDIYCPVHWPIDNRHPHCVTPYHKQELSLICDQRYGKDEMKKQVEVLSQALKISDN
jgi:hypothetical protein